MVDILAFTSEIVKSPIQIIGKLSIAKTRFCETQRYVEKYMK